MSTATAFAALHKTQVGYQSPATSPGSTSTVTVWRPLGEAAIPEGLVDLA